MSFVYIAIIVGAVVIDFLTKQLVVHFMDIGQSIPLIKGVLHLTYVTNDGAAMGMLDDNRWIFMILSTVAIIAMSAYLIWQRNELSKGFGISLAMIIGGGIGNMVDRLFYGSSFGNGEVVDFIDFCAFPKIWKWIFNVADSFVCVGCALFILFFIIDEAKNVKQKKNNA